MRSYIHEIAARILPLWPDGKPLLRSSSCFQLLCSVILSAQCTDDQVNKITPALFATYPDAFSMAGASIEEMERLVRTVGFYHTKARNLIAMAALLVREYGGAVPDTLEELIKLPGVGRKTANLVVSSCFGVPGVIVDTHVLRVANRLGLADSSDANQVELVLRKLLNPSEYTNVSHALNRLGKFVCVARKPACLSKPGTCPVEAICPRKGLDSKFGGQRPY